MAESTVTIPASASAREVLDALGGWFTAKLDHKHPDIPVYQVDATGRVTPPMHARERLLLWDVLSALRGPDNADSDWQLKMATTAVIRGRTKLFIPGADFVHPDHVAKDLLVLQELAGDPVNFTRFYARLKEKSPHFGKIDSHFSGHIGYAVEALRTIYKEAL